MPAQIQVQIDRDVYEHLQQFMVPPVSDVNGAIRALLYQRDGGTSPAAIALEVTQRHFSYAQELERARMGIYDGGGAT